MRSRYGRYDVLYKLGQGAMAQVYLAKDPVLSRLVAVKVLHADLAARRDVLQRFFNEARTVAVVRNPHVVEVFDFGQEGDDLYLVMEFVEGVSLQGMLRRAHSPLNPVDASLPWRGPEGFPARCEPLDPVLTAALMCQAAEGLTIAAQYGVVHRDIKPENMMINRQGYLKISDFGIAHVQDDSITKTGAVLGSPLFMSPEQARGRKPITSQADMFSLGAVFYCCLAGRPPFRGRNITDLFRRIATEPHEPLGVLRPDLDPGLAGLVDMLLRKEPSSRGGGARWLHRQLRNYLTAHGAHDSRDLIAGHMDALLAPGFQSTWKMDAVAATLADTGSSGPALSAATERFTREVRPRFPVFAAVIAAAFLVAAVTGILWGLRMIPDGAEADAIADARTHTAAGPSTPNPGRNAPDDRGSTPDAATEPEMQSGAGENPFNPQGDTGEAGTLVPAGQGAQASGATPGPAEADGVSSLLLRSSPPFAEAYVDGHYVGVTPVRVETLVPGKHRVVLKLRNRSALDTNLALGQGRYTLKFSMDGTDLAYSGDESGGDRD